MRRSYALGMINMLVAASALGYVAGSRQLLAPAPVAASSAACQTFAQTGKQVCGRFLEYWQQNGGLAQQGLPLSDEFRERSSVDGKTYTVQYFERAVFEAHPENQRPNDVLLSLLGREKYLAQYPVGLPGGDQPLQSGLTLTLAGFEQTFSATISAVSESPTRPGCCGQSAQPIKAQGKYVIIALRVTNNGNAPDFLGSAFSIRDSKGRTFTPTADDGGYSTIQPGLSKDVTYYFDVPTDASNFVIVPKKR